MNAEPRPGEVPRPIVYHEPKRDWEGQAAYLICGGPSAAAAIPLLAAAMENVVAINSSYLNFWFADAVVFSDQRWWLLHKDRQEFKDFMGDKISVVIGAERVDIKPMAQWPLPFRDKAHVLCVGVTTVTTGIDYLLHRGVNRIGLVGFDGKERTDGEGRIRIWHHEPHPEEWERQADCFRIHGLEIGNRVAPLLKERGVQVFNTCLDSRHEMFPKRSLKELLKEWR